MMAATVRLSSKGQIVIPKEVRDSLHWGIGVELMLVTTEYGVILQTKPTQQPKFSAKSLRGFLQHKGEPVSTEALCKPVEYTDDRV
ncbi:AbrB/MazE/SpoVT family DNA-binding domain-containing protein [Thiofilum flexile]|uniref:AbrB/MazE/SpoVT family DNA-binding domain-containing protein n=1 Tax=Thiofilum flexile TaxID=125627 RepID=UPI00036326DD|nr:AbrB/MazE/SpoVT family DNA-binding domain-containing protein [Thiofilum flexile]